MINSRAVLLLISPHQSAANALKAFTTRFFVLGSSWFHLFTSWFPTEIQIFFFLLNIYPLQSAFFQTSSQKAVNQKKAKRKKVLFYKRKAQEWRRHKHTVQWGACPWAAAWVGWHGPGDMAPASLCPPQSEHSFLSHCLTSSFRNPQKQNPYLCHPKSFANWKSGLWHTQGKFTQSKFNN